jgi:hypothetical protein
MSELANAKLDLHSARLLNDYEEYGGDITRKSPFLIFVVFSSLQS